jgi:flavin-dependent dehydrogenase
MPLLAFPGGYGGMVHTDGGDVSLSCCIRRDQLERCRQHWPQGKAGATVLAHVRLSCRGVALALAGAAQDGDWLSTGPLRPGIRSFGHDGIFAIGNAAAEAHPVIAEGISMAIQSAALLCEQLLARPGVRCGDAAQRARDAARRAYEAAWRRNFARRLQFAAVCAQLFMRPASARPAARLLAHFPQLLTAGARWSGKASTMRGAQMFSGTGG